MRQAAPDDGLFASGGDNAGGASSIVTGCYAGNALQLSFSSSGGGSYQKIVLASSACRVVSFNMKATAPGSSSFEIMQIANIAGSAQGELGILANGNLA